MQLKIVLVVLCVGFVHCGSSYRAAVVDSSTQFNEDKAAATIREAAQLNVDILMLPELVSISYGNNNKMTEVVSAAAKEAKIYVAAQIVENTQDAKRSVYVFDRNGTVISNPATTDTVVTDVGVFGLMNEAELLTSDTEGARNVIAFGSLSNQFLYALQSWAHTARANLITARAIFGGHTSKHGGLVVAELNSEQPNTFVGQPGLSDLSQYTMEPLRGGRQTVCHESFCCEFDVTAKSGVERPYSLLSYSGVQDVGAGPVRVETCVLEACAGLQDSCLEELDRSTHISKASITARFSTNSKQYPLLVSSSTLDDVTFIQNQTTASIELHNKFTSLGVFGISKEFESLQQSDGDDDMSELFDYVWIRLRVAIFIVSIYVLEMM